MEFSKKRNAGENLMVKECISQENYQQLINLIEIFHNCTDGEGIPIWCFEFIKKLVDGEIKKEEISEKTKALAKEQFDESISWIESMNLKVDNIDELREILCGQ